MSRPAFTLVEVLVAIGIIGILIALLAPALRGVRDAGRETVCLANLGTCHKDMTAFVESNGGAFPHQPGGEWIDISGAGDGSRRISGGYWSVSAYWPSAVRSVAPWPEHFAAWVCPGSRRSPGEPWRTLPDARGGSGYGAPSYLLSDAYRADPRVWMEGTEPSDSLLRPVRAHEVASPAAKVLFYDADMAHLDPFAPESEKDARPIGFGDGHARILKRSESAEPFPNVMADGRAIRLHDTPGGVRGRDY
jgi:prepilin-type N-terminal cleavage/methylation domain-containing protein